MNVNLTQELEKLVQKKVRSGRYNSASEVVREALRLMEQQDELRSLQIQQLRSRIGKGLKEATSGDVVDGEAFVQGLINNLGARKVKRIAR